MTQELIHSINLDTADISNNDASIIALMRDALHPETKNLLEIKIDNSIKSLNLTNLEKDGHRNVEYWINEVPFCLLGARVSILEDNTVLILGSQPAVSDRTLLETEQLPTFSSEESIKDFLNNRLTDIPKIDSFLEKYQKIELHSLKKCYYNPDKENGETDSQELEAAFEVKVLLDELPYSVITNGTKILFMEKRYLKATGSARILDGNPISQKVKSVSTDKLLDTGFLETDLFKTVVIGEPRLQRNDFDFTVNPGENGYAEVHLFFNLLSQFEYFENLGFTWWGPKPLEIHVHARPGNSANNGLYLPGDQPGIPYPQVLMGDGDGVILQNLAFDQDPVSHEISHHIVFRTLKSTTGEALVLHEGLADYFVFARTGDTCLGESICGPSSEVVCYQPQQCLRTASNNLKYGTFEFNNLVPGIDYSHQHGQLISGFLWDIRRDTATSEAEIDALIFRAIDFLSQRSGYQDFLISVFKADKEKESKYFALLEAKAKERGFETFLSAVNQALANFNPSSGNTSVDPEDTTNAGEQTEETTENDEETTENNQESSQTEKTSSSSSSEEETPKGAIVSKETKKTDPASGGCTVGGPNTMDLTGLLLWLLSIIPLTIRRTLKNQ